MNADAAQAWFVAGTIVFMLAGAVHALQALITGTATACFTIATLLSA